MYAHAHGCTIMYRKRDFSLVGEKVILVPYSQLHVDKYHQWMTDPALRKQTASEFLSIEEEHEMQRKWYLDDDMLAKQQYAQDSTSEEDCMVGDVNLFFNVPQNPTAAEIDIMIPESSWRSKGLGTEAVKLMMAYAVVELGVTTFVAKIGILNAPSLKLFQEKLCFVEVSRSSVFEEVTLESVMDEGLRTEYTHLIGTMAHWRRYSPKTPSGGT